MTMEKTALEAIAVNRITTLPGHAPSPFSIFSALSRNWTAFCLKRMDRDFAAMRDLGACTTPADVVQTLGNATSVALSDYERELGHVVDVMSGRDSADH